MSFPDPVKTRRFFDRVGPWFYSFFFTLVGYRTSFRYFLRRHHPRLGLREGARILDVGIGTGFFTSSLLREVPGALTAVGLDFSPGMLTGLIRRLSGLGLRERVRLQLADMRRMPYRDESFDLVVSSAALEYMPDVEKAIAECGRVLRSGGKVLLIVTRTSLMGRLIALLWRNRVFEPGEIKDYMHRSGIERIERLWFPWYFPQVNWWGVAFIGEKK